MNMPTSWSPEEVLEIANIGRCVGYAPSKGRKCNMPINQSNVRHMRALLDELEDGEPNAELLQAKLRRLAGHGLCARWHQDQKEEMVQKWCRKIRRRFPSTPSIIPRPITMQQVEAQTLEETIRDRQQIPCDAQRQLSALQQSPRRSISTTAVSRISTTNIPSLSLSPTPSIELNRSNRSSHTVRNTVIMPSRQITAHGRREPPSTALLSSIPTPPLSSRRTISVTSRATQSPAAPTCSRRHVRRLVVDEECPICYESLEALTPTLPLSVRWCKRGCGKTIHRECINEWRRSCEQLGTRVTCPCCRGQWEDECDC
jgi:hypothetical protein